MFYLYFLNLVNDSKKIKKKELLHFIFPIVLGIINLLNNQFDFLGIHSTILLTSIFIFYSILYTTKIFLLLKNSVWNRNSKIIFINKHNAVIRNWTIFLFLIIIMSVARLLIFLFLDLINNGYSGGKNKLWISGLFFIILFIKILSTPEILYGYNALYKKIKEQKKSNFVLNEIWILSQKKSINNQQDFLLQDKVYANLEKYITNVERLALIERGFRNQKITTTEIAKKLDIPKSHLKYIFKYHSKISITEFKKLIKIHDSLHLIETGFLKLNTLEGLAIKVGFASYNPFFTSFKEITGSTPQAYNKEIKAYKD
jgi:AraC-like DNA-binding protein